MIRKLSIVVIVILLFSTTALADCAHVNRTSRDWDEYFYTNAWLHTKVHYRKDWCVDCGHQLYLGNDGVVNDPESHSQSTSAATTGYGKNATTHWDLQTITKKCTKCNTTLSTETNVKANEATHTPGSYVSGGHPYGTITHYYYKYCTKSTCGYKTSTITVNCPTVNGPHVAPYRLTND